MDFLKEISKEFKILESKMSSEMKEDLTKRNYNELTEFHFSIGLYIRNNVLLKKGKIYQVLEEAGFSYDDMSDFLIKLLYLYLSGEK